MSSKSKQNKNEIELKNLKKKLFDWKNTPFKGKNWKKI